MTEKKTGEPLIKKLGIFNVLLLIVAFAACIVALNELTAAISLVRIGFHMIALACAFFYAVYGYKKNAAKYYKAFLITLGLAKLTMVIVSAVEAGAFGVSTVLFALAFVCAVLLVFAKDMGKTKSVCIVCAMFVLDLVNEIILLVKAADVFSAVIVLAVSFIAVEFVLAKYIDKAERGTK